MSTKMQRDLQDKSDQPAAEPCPHCGLPQTDFRCRPTPNGFWCQAKGLITDPERIITSVQPDPLKPQIEANPKVEHARSKYEQLQAEADNATAEWEEAALAAFQARQQRSAARREMVIGGRLQEVITPGTAPSLGQLQRLEDAAAQANTMREFHGEKALAARQELDACRLWVRTELETVAQVQRIREQHAPLST